MFGTNLDVEISCLDPQCGGTLVAQFKDKTGWVTCTSECSSCQQTYDVHRKNWSDTPEDEIGWEVTLHHE